MFTHGDREETQISNKRKLREQGKEVQLLGSESQSHLLAFGGTGVCLEGGKATKGMWPLPTMLPKAERGKDLPLPPALPTPISVKISDGRGRPLAMHNGAIQGRQMDLSTNRPKVNTSAKLKQCVIIAKCMRM